MRLIILRLSMFMLASILAPTYSQWNQAYYLAGGFNGFCFADSLNGWFTHQGTSKIIHTSDGGYNFDVQYVIPGQYTMYDVLMENQLNGWSCGSNTGTGPGYIYRTTDGGNAWIQKTHPASQSNWGQIEQVGSDIWIIGAYDNLSSEYLLILKTSDDGVNWNLFEYPQIIGAAGIYLFDSLNFIVHGVGGLLKRTTDGGTSWISTSLPSDYQVERVVFVDQNIGYALVSDFDPSPTDSYLYQSTDGGFTWNLHYSWVDQGQKQGISIIPETNIVLVAGYVSINPNVKGIQKSTDGGITWNVIQTQYLINNLYTPSLHYGWAGSGSMIYRYDYVTPPTIEPISNQLIQFGESFTYQVNATGMGLKYSMTNNPPGLAMGLYSGLIDGTPTVGGKYEITVAVQDTDINVVNDQFRLKVNRKPHFLPPIPDTLAFVDSIYYAQINAEDLDGDTLSVRPLSIPSFLNMYVPIGGSTLAVLEGTPDSSYIGYHNISIEVLDNYGGKDTISWMLHVTSKITFIDDINALPNEFMLYQNYPNPFNPRTKIVYSIPSLGAQSIAPVQLKVYDVLGNEVATLVDEHKPSGFYEIKFDAASLSSGVYFYELKAGDFLAVKRMLLMK